MSIATEVRGHGKSILLVEDDASIRRALQRALTNEGYTVFAASGGAAALETLSDPAVRVDLVVSDLVMPQMRGEDLARALRVRFPTVPVLLMSGQSWGAAMGQIALEPGVFFVEKPFSLETLFLKIREALR